MENKEVSGVSTENSKKKGSSWYYYVLVIIIVIVIAVIVVNLKQNEISGLQKQVNQLKDTNTNLNSRVSGFSILIDSLRNFSETSKGGNVPFWDQNSNDIVTGTVPLNFYGARVLSQNIISKNSEKFTDNLSFNKVIQNKTIWTASFTCSNVNDSSCGATVVIDEANRAYSVTSA